MRRRDGETKQEFALRTFDLQAAAAAALMTDPKVPFAEGGRHALLVLTAMNDEQHRNAVVLSGEDMSRAREAFESAGCGTERCAVYRTAENLNYDECRSAFWFLEKLKQDLESAQGHLMSRAERADPERFAVAQAKDGVRELLSLLGMDDLSS